MAHPLRRWAQGFGLFCAGLVCGAGLTGARADGDFYAALTVFTEALYRVQTDYVRPRPDADLLRSALDGMLGDLDPYSQYLDAEAYRELRDDTRGRYFGVGIVLEIQEEAAPPSLLIQRVIEGGPAASSGLQPGDRIVAVDQRQVAADAELALRGIRGPKGTEVTLSILRRGWEQPRPIPLTRSRIQTRAVEFELREGGIGVAQVTQFQENAARDLRRTLNRNRRALTGLVLDLRSNPGGLLDEATELSDLFLGPGAVVTTCSRRGVLTQDRSTEATPFPDLPMVVLIDGGSASAAEIVAGALQDRARAPLMGSQSYGKGSVQQVFGLSDQSALKLTIARYLTPSGLSLDGEGIAPDFDLEGGIEMGPDGAIQDPVLDTALAFLAGTSELSWAPRDSSARTSAAEQCAALVAGD